MAAFVPQEWDQDVQRRRATGVPDEARHQEKWRLALDVLAELSARGLTT